MADSSRETSRYQRLQQQCENRFSQEVNDIPSKETFDLSPLEIAVVALVPEELAQFIHITHRELTLADVLYENHHAAATLFDIKHDFIAHLTIALTENTWPLKFKLLKVVNKKKGETEELSYSFDSFEDIIAYFQKQLTATIEKKPARKKSLQPKVVAPKPEKKIKRKPGRPKKRS